MRDGMKVTQWRRANFLRPAASYKTNLVGKEEVARGTVAFRLKKPEGFTYAAGQAIYVTLPGQKESDSKGRVRTFSIASAPQEPELVIATRMTESAFKDCLADLPAGSSVGIEGPYGDLTLDGHTRPAVFLAGGIGITPFRCLILDAVAHGLSCDFILFYSNHSPADAAFLPELEQLARDNPRFRLVATMTDAADWQGERGYITREMIERHVGSIAKSTFYLAGPPAMVAAMEDMLIKAGVESRSIRAEMFAGY
ncbi:MAG TPA: FAD-dependent oxidoreductase [Sinorhizobium sp.]|nr:FAD-dependent oxidoreductase [Sinorhizobium sp.]